ncbi:MAG: DoxX family protein [Hyphomicrobiales bacterium]|nr:DoxX family protein [Hyphomicrobiales bacterium]
MQSNSTSNGILLLARILLAGEFLLAGVNKIMNYGGTGGYMAKMHVPAALLPLVILTEIGCGLAVIVGWQTRIAAFLLAGFTFLAAIIFHNPEGGQMAFISFLHHTSIIGGFLALVGLGAGGWSLDATMGKKAAA